MEDNDTVKRSKMGNFGIEQSFITIITHAHIVRIQIWVFFPQKIHGFLGNVLHIVFGPKAIANSAGNPEFILDKTTIKFIINEIRQYRHFMTVWLSE